MWTCYQKKGNSETKTGRIHYQANVPTIAVSMNALLAFLFTSNPSVINSLVHLPSQATKICLEAFQVSSKLLPWHFPSCFLKNSKLVFGHMAMVCFVCLINQDINEKKAESFLSFKWNCQPRYLLPFPNPGLKCLGKWGCVIMTQINSYRTWWWPENFFDISFLGIAFRKSELTLAFQF